MKTISYSQMDELQKIWEKAVLWNPDIAGEVFVDTMERMVKGVDENFNAEAYFKTVYNKKVKATPKEKGRNNLKEINIVSISDNEEDIVPAGCISDLVFEDIEEGYEMVETRVSMEETIIRLKDEVELNNLDFGTLVEALNERFVDPVSSEITLSRFLLIDEIRDLIKEVLGFNNALKVIQLYC